MNVILHQDRPWTYTVIDSQTGTTLGSAGLRRLDAAGREAEIDIDIHDATCAAEALKTLASRACGEGLERLELRATMQDAGRIRAGLAAGFGIEGIRRGVPQDQVILARLASDPAGPTARTLPDLPGGRLTDEIVELRPLRPSDADDYLALESEPDVARYRMGGPVTRQSAAMRCATAEYRWLAGDMAQCVITDAATQAFAGTIQLVNREPATATMMLGYALLPQARGKGLATRAVNLLTDWAFTIGAIRVVAGTFPDNTSSRAVLQRAGFTLEAVFEAALPGPNGTRIDNVQLIRISPLPKRPYGARLLADNLRLGKGKQQ